MLTINIFFATTGYLCLQCTMIIVGNFRTCMMNTMQMTLWQLLELADVQYSYLCLEGAKGRAGRYEADWGRLHWSPGGAKLSSIFEDGAAFCLHLLQNSNKEQRRHRTLQQGWNCVSFCTSIQANQLEYNNLSRTPQREVIIFRRIIFEQSKD